MPDPLAVQLGSQASGVSGSFGPCALATLDELDERRPQFARNSNLQVAENVFVIELYDSILAVLSWLVQIEANRVKSPVSGRPIWTYPDGTNNSDRLPLAAEVPRCRDSSQNPIPTARLPPRQTLKTSTATGLTRMIAGAASATSARTVRIATCCLPPEWARLGPSPSLQRVRSTRRWHWTFSSDSKRHATFDENRRVYIECFPAACAPLCIFLAGMLPFRSDLHVPSPSN